MSLNIPHPGKPYGPCADVTCRHRDCAWQRETAARACVLCHQPIGFGMAFYESEGDVAHATCVDEELRIAQRHLA